MTREMMLWGLILFSVACVAVVWKSQDAASPGAVLTVVEQWVSIENEDLPTSPDSGRCPKAIYLSRGDQVRLVFDPVYEVSVDGDGHPIRMQTPFSHQGLSGSVPRNALSRGEVTGAAQLEPRE